MNLGKCLFYRAPTPKTDILSENFFFSDTPTLMYLRHAQARIQTQVFCMLFGMQGTNALFQILK